MMYLNIGSIIEFTIYDMPINYFKFVSIIVWNSFRVKTHNVSKGGFEQCDV